MDFFIQVPREVPEMEPQQQEMAAVVMEEEVKGVPVMLVAAEMAKELLRQVMVMEPVQEMETELVLEMA